MPDLPIDGLASIFAISAEFAVIRAGLAARVLALILLPRSAPPWLPGVSGSIPEQR